jgi:hypothetical protein
MSEEIRKKVYKIKNFGQFLNESIYYHGTVLPKSNTNIDVFKTKIGYRSNLMAGIKTEVNSPWVFFTDDYNLARKFGSAKTDGLYHNKGDFSHKTVVLKYDINESNLNILDLTTDDYIEKIEKNIDSIILTTIYGSMFAFYDMDIDDTWELLDEKEISDIILKNGFNSVKLIENGGKSLAIHISKVNRITKQIK